MIRNSGVSWFWGLDIDTRGWFLDWVALLWLTNFVLFIGSLVCRLYGCEYINSMKEYSFQSMTEIVICATHYPTPTS